MTIAGSGEHAMNERARIGGGLRIGGRLASVALALMLVVVLGATSALAAKAAEDKKKDTGGNFSERNLKKIQKMFELQEAGDIPAAKAILESINIQREKPYGRSKIYQFLGSFAQQEENYDKAIELLDKAVAEGGLTEDEELRTLFQVGMLQVKQERYEDAIVTIEKWMAEAPEINGQAYYTLAVTYYQANKLDKALAPAQKAIEVATTAPPESWYRLLLALYLDANNYDEGIALLDEMIVKFPKKKEYWTQLAALYNANDRMDKSLAVQQLARYEGFITEDRDLTRMAQMFMVQGLPHRGAQVMKEGLESGAIEPTMQAYQTYSDTLLQSREWALALDPIAKAAELADNGSMWVRHAQVNLQLGNWSDARDSLTKAFQKGNVPDEGQAHILFGIAAANDKLWDTAITSFKRASNYPGTADVSTKWMAFVEREKMRFATPEEQAQMAAERAAAAAAEGGDADKKAGDEKKADGTTTRASADAEAKAATSKN
jgi:tetratricopeptide (TPR) repeat protein